MGTWPRTITRGQLKGETYENESAYRRALRDALGGVSRHEQRNRLAQKLGYRNYSERRKVKETIGEYRHRELKRRHGNRFQEIVNHEISIYRASTTRRRVGRMKDYIRELGVSNVFMPDENGVVKNMIWANVYQWVDETGLR